MLFPLNLELKGRKCVVVGGGSVALRKTNSLLKAGALVTLVAPDIMPELAELAQNYPLALEKRAAKSEDFTGALLVFVATNDAETNEKAARAAKESGALVNMASEPLSLSDFSLPASMEEGELLLTVSTGGKSPALSRRIKERLAPRAKNYAALLEMVAPYREGAKTRFKDSRKNEAFWRQTLDEEFFQMVEQGNFDEAEERIINALNSFGT